MIQTYTCLTCGHLWVYGLDRPMGVGDDDPLPGDLYAETCSECHPELDD